MSRSLLQKMLLVPAMVASGDPFAFLSEGEEVVVDDQEEEEDIFADCASLVLEPAGPVPDGDMFLRWEELDVKELIGYGSYGRVHRAVHRPSAQVVAVKFVDKRKLSTSAHFRHHHAMERRVLPLISGSRFVARCLAILETSRDVVLVEEFVPGGELYYHLQQRKRGALPESQVRFYASEVVCVLQDLHAVGVLYRDLKPENLMLDAGGHIKLVDFGLSTILPSTSSSFATSAYYHSATAPYMLTSTYCGTAEYIAPEVLRAQAYGFAVDVWGLGCVIYEMLTGQPPFPGDSQNAMFAKILSDPIKVPRHTSDELRHLLGQLLHKDPRRRPTLEQVCEHAWFRTVDWRDVRAKRAIPPIRPLGCETARQAQLPDNVEFAESILRQRNCDEDDADNDAVLNKSSSGKFDLSHNKFDLPPTPPPSVLPHQAPLSSSSTLEELERQDLLADPAHFLSSSALLPVYSTSSSSSSLVSNV